MKRYSALWLVFITILMGCAVAGGTYRTGCYNVYWGDFEIDPETGDWYLGGSGLCIERLNEACDPLKDFKFVMGVDDNGDGIIQDSERMGPAINDPNPTGNLICAGAGSGSVGSGKKGKKLIVHYEVKKGDESTPFISDTKTPTVR